MARNHEAAARSFKALHASGGFRTDVKLEDVVMFINIVANGMAVATSLGLEVDPDALVKLVHGGLDPQ